MLLSQHTRIRFARAVLLIEAAALAALGVSYWIRPQEMANFAGILLMEGGSVGLMRAWLGSLPLVLAIVLSWAQHAPERLPLTLATVAATSAGLLATRLISLGLDPVEVIGFDRLCLLWWLASALLAGAGWLLTREKPASASKAARRPMPLEPPQPFRRGEAHTPAPPARTPPDSAIVAFRRSESLGSGG